MQEVRSLDGPARGSQGPFGYFAARVRRAAPTPSETAWAVLSALLLVLAFPDFDCWPLAWCGLVPVLLVVVRRPQPARAFLLGWTTGTIFFYGSCYWLTYPMIHYAEIPAWVAYPLFLPAPLIAGIFPAVCLCALARLVSRWGARALWLLPSLWTALEWARLGIIGQLWNALGYSQADEPHLIQAARYGGVYAVSFLCVASCAALAYALHVRTARAYAWAALALGGVALIVVGSDRAAVRASAQAPATTAVVVAVQPNVVPDFGRSAQEMARLTAEHFDLSEQALAALDRDAATAALPRVVVWPESPMNFTYARSADLRERVARFARAHRSALIFNSLEPAPDEGAYNAAVYVDEEGRLAVQYDKIRLMPFGEYVPLPRWMPGASAVRGVVGEFTPGTHYTLMPLADRGDSTPRAGIFICLESAYPEIARRFAREGADVLIELTNDSYQGDTAVVGQHLANAVLRAVETGRTLLRVTDTGISARISARGEVLDRTPKFQTAVRAWPVGRADGAETFYVRHGDLFVALCAVTSLLAVAFAEVGGRRAGRVLKSSPSPRADLL